jgi:aminocarboxymuconate-semialdehyde decarboxylase
MTAGTDATTAGDAGEWWPELAPLVPESAATKPAYRTVDVHTHLSVPAGTALAAPYLRPELEPRSLYSSPETLRYNKEYRASARQSGQFEDAEVRLADMDRQGIDVQVLSVPPTEYFYWLDEKEAPRWRTCRWAIRSWRSRSSARLVTTMGSVASS